MAGTLSGSVKDNTGAFAARIVRAYQRDTGAMVGETTSNATTGAWSIATVNTDTHYAVCLDNNGDENALILDNLTPIGSSLLPHRYWRVVFSAVNATLGYPDAYLMMREFELLEGATDWTTGRGAYAAHSSNALLQGNASDAVDNFVSNGGLFGTRWNGTYTWSIDLGSARLIDAFTLTCDSNNDTSPKNFTVQFSDDNSAWFDAKVVTNQTGWTTFEKRTFSLEASAAPAYRYWRVYASNAPAAQYGNNTYFRRIELLDASNTDQAAGSTLTADVSSLSGSYPLSNLVNPDVSAANGTLWYVSGLSTEAMFQIDLGSAETITSLGLTAAASWPGGDADFPRNFRVTASADGSTWTDVDTVTAVWTSGALRQVFAL